MKSIYSLLVNDNRTFNSCVCRSSGFVLFFSDKDINILFEYLQRLNLLYVIALEFQA